MVIVPFQFGRASLFYLCLGDGCRQNNLRGRRTATATTSLNLELSDLLATLSGERYSTAIVAVFNISIELWIFQFVNGGIDDLVLYRVCGIATKRVVHLDGVNVDGDRTVLCWLQGSAIEIDILNFTTATEIRPCGSVLPRIN